MVIHGGVDGFARIPVFLHCSTNNKADCSGAVSECSRKLWVAVKGKIR